MKFNRYVFGLSLGISLLGSSLHAQQQLASAPITATVPRLVNFSGKAADAQGKAIAGIAGVTFAIYKEQYEGAPLWLETQNALRTPKATTPFNWAQPNPTACRSIFSVRATPAGWV